MLHATTSGDTWLLCRLHLNLTSSANDFPTVVPQLTTIPNIINVPYVAGLATTSNVDNNWMKKIPRTAKILESN